MPLDRRTRATLRRAELGFLGVMILTCKQTPRFCGQPCRAGCFGLRYCCRRGLRTSWLIVGIEQTPVCATKNKKALRYSPEPLGSREKIRKYSVDKTCFPC